MIYWDQLKSMKMLSLQRRLERYHIIYTWKVLEGLVPDCGMHQYEAGRSGTKCKIPPINKKATSIKSEI